VDGPQADLGALTDPASGDGASGDDAARERAAAASNVAAAHAASDRAAAPPGRRLPFAAVNLISDPIHGYVELAKRLTAHEARAAGLHPETVAEDDLLDTAWVQRLRRISQLQSARWVFPTAEHSRFTHGLGVMHEAGLWARSLYPSLAGALPVLAPGERVPSEGLVVETLRVAELERHRAQLADLSEEEWEHVDVATRAAVAKLLHEPTVLLKEAAGTPRGERLVEALRILFDL